MGVHKFSFVLSLPAGQRILPIRYALNIMQEAEIRNIIAKYLAGEASPQEENDLRHWVDLSPENTAYFEAAYAIWEQSGALPEVKSFDMERAWSEIRGRAGIADATPATRVRSLKWNQIGIRVAAAAVVLAGLGWALYTGIIVPNRQPEYLSFVTGTEKERFFLPDSSEVWLNAQSELQYEAGFRGEERRSTLKGEAFFSVRRNEQHPFVITTGETRTRVLGTSFNVRAYEAEDEISVSVASGKVSFGTMERQVALVAGEQGVFSNAGQTVQKAAAGESNANAWQTGRLVFDNRELTDVAQDLSRYFGISVSFSDPKLARCHYSGSFDHPELSYALEVIAATVNMTYTLQGSQVTFSGRGCDASGR